MPAPLKFADHGVFDDSLRGIDRAGKRVVACYAGPLAARRCDPGSSGGHPARLITKLLAASWGILRATRRSTTGL
jgi:hypothetical protein